MLKLCSHLALLPMVWAAREAKPGLDLKECGDTLSCGDAASPDVPHNERFNERPACF